MSTLMEMNKHGLLAANGHSDEIDDPMAELLQAQVADLTQAVDEAIVQAKRIGREVHEVKGRRERLRAIAERGGHKVRRLAKEHREKLHRELDESGSSSASQVTLSVFDHNAGRAEQVLAAIGKGERLSDPVPGWRR